MNNFLNHGASSLKRHEAQCSICRSPSREEFDEAFLSWSGPLTWREDFNFNKYAVYRHARACGLLERRRQNLSFALERVAERIDGAVVSGSNIIAAVRLLAEIEEKKQKRMQETPAGCESSRAEVVPAPEVPDSGELAETANSDADTPAEEFTPAAEAEAEPVEVSETANSDADTLAEESTPAVSAEESSEVLAADSEAEPVEV